MHLHRFLCIACVAATLAIAGITRAPGAGQVARTFERTVTRTLQANYLLHLPPDYQAGDAKRWPLLLFLHGAGERGTNLEKVKVHGPPKLVLTQPSFPFILVSPQCPENERWSNDVLLGLVDEVIARYQVDTNRVYVTGLSMGGFGTWSLALQNPHRFAAIAPICGGGESVDLLLASPERTAALKTLGIWAFHGAKDPVVTLDESERLVRALRKLGVKEVELTVYLEASHDCWTETYQNPKLYEWLLKHERKPR